MTTEIGEKVRFLTHNNEISTEICIIAEICNDNTVKLKKPNGEMMRIFSDRIRPVEMKTISKQSVNNEKFDPWAEIDDGEVWLKQSKFNSSIVMKSYTIINLSKQTYRSVNVYNDKISNINIKDFKLENCEKLTAKLAKKGYKKMAKEN